jgi:hypothetical protein
MLGTLRRVRKAWKPSESVPPRDTLPPSYRPVAEVRGRLDERLGEAVNAERRRAVEWLRIVGKHVAADVQPRQLSEAVIGVALKASQLGVFGGPSIHDLQAAAQAFSQSAFGACRSAFDSAQGDETIATWLPILSRQDFQNAMSATVRFIEVADELLEATGRRVATDVGHLRQQDAATDPQQP